MILQVGDKVKMRGTRKIGEVKHIYSEKDRMYSRIANIVKVVVYYTEGDYEVTYTIDELIKCE